MCLGVQQPFRQRNPNLKRTQCPKAIKTGRRSAGESLLLASADGYTLLLYPSALFPSPVSLCSILCIISLYSHERTHKHLSLSLLPTCFPFQPVNLDADEGHVNLIFAATFRGRAVLCDFMSIRDVSGASVYHPAQC